MPSKRRHGSEGLGSTQIKRKHENISSQIIYCMLGWDNKNRPDTFLDSGCMQGNNLIQSEGSSNGVGF